MNTKKGLIFIAIAIIAITALILYFHISSTTVSENSVEKAIQEAVLYLEKNQNEDGSIAIDNDERLKVWDTAVALYGLIVSGYADSLVIDKAVKFLMKAKRMDGSYYYRLSDNLNQYCTETTSAVLIDFSLLGMDQADTLSFLLEKQYPEGYWEFGYTWIKKAEDRRFPSATGYALSALGYCGYPKDENIEKGLKYLIDTQLEDGSWGYNPVVYQVKYYAIYRNLVAFQIYGIEDKEVIRKAVNLVYREQNKDGYWEDKVSKNATKEGITIAALNILLVAGEDPRNESIQRGIKWLLEHQRKDGSWPGGYFITQPTKKHEDIYTTSMAIVALKRYQLALHGEKPPFFIKQ